jgi:hypothetical protein
MDQNVRDVLIALVTVAGGLLTALLVTRLSNANTRRLERDRWKRELYATLYHEASSLRDSLHEMALGDAPEPGWGKAIERAQRAIAEISMLEPTMKPAVNALWEATGNLLKLVGPGAPTDQYAALDDACRLALNAFIEATADDLK